MNSKAVYIIPSDLFNPQSVDKSLNEIAKEDIIYLAESLYLNILENLQGKENKFDVYCIWSNYERDYLPEELKKNNLNFIYTDLSDKVLLFEKLSTKEFLSHKNNLIVSSDVIDLKPNDYYQCFKLLSSENESLVIAKIKMDLLLRLGLTNTLKIYLTV
ncbi:MAG: hypothetical protein IPJ23_03515 [Ignavibacteriales bacterium]|nr:hypothetical protein [Ignavibacteriales bacterium]